MLNPTTAAICIIFLLLALAAVTVCLDDTRRLKYVTNRRLYAEPKPWYPPSTSHN